MPSSSAVLVFVVIGVLPATSGCHSCSAASGPDGSAAVPRDGAVAVGESRFSRPIAALHLPSGSTLVAGLVAAHGAVAVTSLAPDGASLWAHEVLSGVVWSANATLTMLPSPEGVVVVWRGPDNGKDTSVGVVVHSDGRVDGASFPVGAAPCATLGGLAWIEPGREGASLVEERAFAAAGAVVALTIPEGRDPALLCGQHRAFAFGEGENDVLLHLLEAGRERGLRVIRDTDFADEERGHETYLVGDTLGLVRFGASGSVAAREIGADEPSAWRRLGGRLTASDDIAAVDADRQSGVVVFTRDASAGDSSTSASSVRAIVWERAGSREASYELAPVDQARDRGPFWSGAVSAGLALGWAERPTGLDVSGAPILGMGYIIVNGDGGGQLHHVVRAADDLVDAGCDESRCYAVALVRGPGEDGGSPEAVSVLVYP